MEKLISILVGLGAPGLILFLLISTSGLAGAAALTAALAAFGPGGMIGGLVSLGLVGLISSVVGEYGFNTVLKNLINSYKENGYSKEDVVVWIEKLWIFRGTKNKLLKHIEDNWD